MSRVPRLLVAAVAATVLASGSLVVAPPATTVAARRTPHFLSLPFKATKGMHIQQANIWLGAPTPGRVHGGIDYINGTPDRPRTWRTFPVYAAAAGYACANLTGRKGCIEGIGNRVLITHTVNGRTYRTYYGHLEAISTRIPLGGKRTVYVRRGELLGYAGYSGDPCCVRHLHFQLFDPNWRTVDPYGIDGTRGEYPNPQGTNGIHNGRRSYWISDPPTEPGRFITDRRVREIPYPGQKPSRHGSRKPRRTPRPSQTQRAERTPGPARTRRPEATPRPSVAPTPTPTPSQAPPRPGPSLVATTTSVLVWWTRVVTQMLSALRGGL